MTDGLCEALLPDDVLLDLTVGASYQVPARLVICDAFGEVSRDSYFEAEPWLAKASELEIEAVRDRNWRLNLVHDTDRGALLAAVLHACLIDDLNGEIAELVVDHAAAYAFLRSTQPTLWSEFVCEDLHVTMGQGLTATTWFWRHGPLGEAGFECKALALQAAATALSPAQTSRGA